MFECKLFGLKLCLSREGKQVAVEEGGINREFVDLMPVNDADISEGYQDALRFAVNSKRIKNIALTGPYGSGKSSIIDTFAAHSTYEFLRISLASFKEKASGKNGDNEEGTSSLLDDDKEHNNLIERSILQQMLYGKDSNKLTYSRFKRIRTPKHALAKSLSVVIWFMCCLFLHACWSMFEGGGFVAGWYWLWFIPLLAYAFAIPAVIICDLYRSSYGCSLKKFSLKNVEIESKDIPENSILNRHLDEIIYFFQSTDYDVVVIEDLDRFGSPEIFVKLREINKLINDNSQVKKSVKFLYALKDDMFAHKSRAKFFDFIIPVVPVINSTNAIDRIQRRLNSESYAGKIDKRFLEEVSLYLDDLRLIHNIFNEFSVYYNRLKSDQLDSTKLLAMMIYKNAYPNDFEALHHRKGALFNVCAKKEKLIDEIRASSQKRIAEIHADFEGAEQENLRNEQELINSYIGYIVSQANGPCSGICLQDGQTINISQLKDIEHFERLFNQANINLLLTNNHRPLPLNKSFADVEEEINPGRSFEQRKEALNNKTSERQLKLQSEIAELNKEVSELIQLSLSQVLERGQGDVRSIISNKVSSNSDLLVYLINEGYLDEDYSIYTSNFYEGRWFPNDRDFVLAIRNRSKVDPRRKIDTPAEVCRKMRPEDFSQKYVLNLFLIDYLVGSKEEKYIKDAFKYISQNFSDTDEFFSAYYQEAKEVSSFISGLSTQWSGFFSGAIGSDLSIQHIASILHHAEPLSIVEMNMHDVVTDFLSEKGNLIYASEVEAPVNYDLLKQLEVRFQCVQSLKGNDELLQYINEECLYTITPDNIDFVVHEYGDRQQILDINKANYTTIISSGCEALKRYVSDNLSSYIDHVFLSLPDNSLESEEVVKDLVNIDVLSEQQKKNIISKELHCFESLTEIPESLWAHALDEEKVSMTWDNISQYLEAEDSVRDTITELLNRSHVVDQLAAMKMNAGGLSEEDVKALSNFVRSNDSIEGGAYDKLMQTSPYRYKDFPANISREKIISLIQLGKVPLYEESFSTVDNDAYLTALLIQHNIDKFFENIVTYPVGDDVRKQLLIFDLDTSYKELVVQGIAVDSVEDDEDLAQWVAEVIKLPKVDCDNFEYGVISAAVGNAKSISDSLQILMKCIPMWNESATMAVISLLPEPFDGIASYGEKRPKLLNTEENMQFAALLKKRGFISTVKDAGEFIRIFTFDSTEH